MELARASTDAERGSLAARPSAAVSRPIVPRRASTIVPTGSAATPFSGTNPESWRRFDGSFTYTVPESSVAMPRSPATGGTLPRGRISCGSGIRSRSTSATALGNTGASGNVAGVPGTSNVHCAGVGSGRPSSSTERTASVCGPGASPVSETGERHGAVQRVARQLGYGVESVRLWVKQADIDDGEAPGTTSQDAERIRRLEQENRELRRANEILKRASAFFAAELDRPQK